jgi:putative spermidine/putrescine transport system permease protein
MASEHDDGPRGDASRGWGDRWLRLKWRVMDGVLELKGALPSGLFRSRRNGLGYAFLLPGVVLVGFLFAGMVLLLQYSFLTYDPYEFIIYEYTLENWVEALTNDAFRTIFLRTLKLSLVVTVLSVVFGFPYAYLTVRAESELLRKLLLAGVFVPFFTGTIVRAYGWLIILGKRGLVNSVATGLGTGRVDVFGTETAVVIGLFQLMLPFAILMLVPAIRTIDRSLERAAVSLGADRLRTFRYVVVPLSKPGITAASIVVFTISMANFAIPWFLGAGTVDFMANFIHSILLRSSNYPLASALSVALVMVTSTIVLAVFYFVGAGTMGLTVEEDTIQGGGGQ